MHLACSSRWSTPFPGGPHKSCCLWRASDPNASRGTGHMLLGNPVGTQRNPIRILLVDDNAVFRTGLRALLERRRGFKVVGEAGSGDEAVACATATRPHVVVMDLLMPGGGGLEATRRIVALGSGARILVLTVVPERRELLEALEAGAAGFVEKTSPLQEGAHRHPPGAGGGGFGRAGAAQLGVLQRDGGGERNEDRPVAGDAAPGGGPG